MAVLRTPMLELAPVFTPYAQNFEDVPLWRALRQVEQGFYIDIGAWPPDTDSVTKTFYEHGWRGINIEPNPHWYRQLAAKGAGNTNLELVLRDVCGTQTLYLVHESGLSSFNAREIRRHRQNGLQSIECQVEVVTLAQVCVAHVPQGQPIHFLKIDVEGDGANVLRGHDRHRWCPWIVADPPCRCPKSKHSQLGTVPAGRLLSVHLCRWIQPLLPGGRTRRSIRDLPLPAECVSANSCLVPSNRPNAICKLSTEVCHSASSNHCASGQNYGGFHLHYFTTCSTAH